MAIASIDEVMLREPRLLVPGLPPVSLVKVNKPYTEFLSPKIKAKRKLSWVESAGQIGIGNKRFWGPFANTDVYVKDNSFGAAVNSYPYTIGFVVRADNVSTEQCVLSCGNSASYAERIQLDFYDGNFRFIAVDTSYSAGTAQVPVSVNTDLYCVCVGNSATDRYLAVNGVLAQSTTNISLPANFNHTTIGFRKTAESVAPLLYGYVTDLLFLPAALTKIEAVEMSKNYYMFLDPA